MIPHDKFRQSGKTGVIRHPKMPWRHNSRSKHVGRRMTRVSSRQTAVASRSLYTVLAGDVPAYGARPKAECTE